MSSLLIYLVKKSYQKNYYIKHKSHTKLVEAISDEDVGDGDHGIRKGKLRQICHNIWNYCKISSNITRTL